ncbi:hypothetical protein AB7M16_002580 [Bradyrhizobium sp. USDA 372]
MLSAIKWNSRTREWVMLAMTLVVGVQANRQEDERKQRQPLWKHFDDTHHWDETAEEWVPNQDH